MLYGCKNILETGPNVARQSAAEGGKMVKMMTPEIKANTPTIIF
jgi:hypothetical protein